MWKAFQQNTHPLHPLCQQRLLMVIQELHVRLLNRNDGGLRPFSSAAVCPLDDISGPAVSIQTEMALEQLKQKHDQELQQLRIQLETQVKHPQWHSRAWGNVDCKNLFISLFQVNYYERSLEQMRQSMELERKDICQNFKVKTLASTTRII